MSSLVYPVLPGLMYPVGRDIVMPEVKVRTTLSDREFRARDAFYPRYRYRLQYEFLRTGRRGAELEQLVSLYEQVGGAFDTFLYSDDADNSVTAQPIGVGDGATNQYQLVRAWGGFAEPVYDLDGWAQLYINGTPINMLTFGAQLDNAVWTGSATVTPNVGANPVNGAIDVDRVADTSTSGLQTKTQTVTVPNDSSPYVFSFYVLKTSGGTSPTMYVTLDFSGGSVPVVAHPRIDTDTGTALSLSGATSVTSVSVGSYWRISVVASNNSTGNTTASIGVGPALTAHGLVNSDVTQTGSVDLYGLKLERGTVATGYTSLSGVIGATGLVTFSVNVSAGISITWTGSFYRRCRFLGTSLDTDKFLVDLYTAKRVEFISVKP